MKRDALRTAGVLLLFALWETGWSQETPAEPAPVEVLVRQLSSASRSVRFRAEELLIERGEEVLESLPDSRVATDAALQEALTRIRRKVAENAASEILQQGGLTVPESVHSCLDLVGFLNATSGNVITVGQIGPLLAQTAWPSGQQQRPFFSLLDDATFSSQAGWRWIPGTRRIELTRLPPDEVGIRRIAPVYGKGCRVELAGIREQRNYVDPQQRKVYRALLNLDVEPGLRPFWLTVADREFTISSEGKALSLLNPEARREIMPQGGRFLFPVDFATPVDDIPQTMDLDGRARVRVAVRPVEVTFREGDATVHHVGEMEIKLLEWVSTDHLLARLEVTFDSPLPELESHRQGLLHRDVVLRGSDGRAWSPRSIQLKNSDGLTHVVEYEFPPDIGGPGQTLAYMAPTLVTDAEIEFKFLQVPLMK